MIIDSSVGAYLLACDAEGIKKTLPKYYDHIGKLVVSFDSNSLGWSGKRIDSEASLNVIREIDTDKKAIFLSANYSSKDRTRSENELIQRKDALHEASKYCKWVLQIDSDEVVPNISSVLALIPKAEQLNNYGIEWPMKVIFRTTKNHWYEVVNADKTIHIEYPAPIIIRSDSDLVSGRRIKQKSIRLRCSRNSSLQVIRQNDDQSITLLHSEIDLSQSIKHFSWGRKVKIVFSKFRNNAHFGRKRDIMYFLIWLFSPWIYRILRNFNPVSPGLWPRLKKVESHLQF